MGQDKGGALKDRHDGERKRSARSMREKEEEHPGEREKRKMKNVSGLETETAIDDMTSHVHSSMSFSCLKLQFSLFPVYVYVCACVGAWSMLSMV
jgi:hypothetical protein